MSNEETKVDNFEAEESSDKKERKGGHGGKGGPRGEKKQLVTLSANPELEERVVAVNRVAKVVKGGRRFSFSALIIVGDKKGRVGYGLGKAKEVPDAIRKAGMKAATKMIKVPLDNGTIPHEIFGEYDAGKILFKPAAEGTGIKAAGACRSILELVGVKNVLTKSLRGNNPHNVVKATFKALQTLRSVEDIAAVRGKDKKSVKV
ncbi:MAG: 30S ribosomal protein S5 [Bacteriovoracaceae bacterium]